MKDNFVWAGKRTSCGGLFTVVECCSWTGNHRSVWFIFGSESGSPRRFLRINHSFKVTRKRLKCLENAFPAINFSKKFGGGLVVGFAPSALAGDGSAGRRSEDFNPVLSGKACPCPPNRFHPVRLIAYVCTHLITVSWTWNLLVDNYQVQLTVSLSASVLVLLD